MTEKDNLGEFTCDCCKGKFKQKKTMEQSFEEYKQSSFYVPNVKAEDLAIACDDCAPSIKAYYESLTEDKKQELIEEFLRSIKVND